MDFSNEIFVLAIFLEINC